jgi:hypothetical protein
MATDSESVRRELAEGAHADVPAPEHPSPLTLSESASADSARGWEPSNTHPSNTKVVASCLDTLHVGYRQALAPALAAELESKRALMLAQDEAARAAWDEGSAESEITLSGTRFVLRPSAHHGYRYRLFNDDLALFINPKPPPSVPAIMAQLRSAFLWREGWQRASALTGAIAEAFRDPSAEAQPPMLSRLDVCADFQGWVPRESDRLRFVCRARDRDSHHTAAGFTGFTLGRGVILGRIYDKTAELAVSGKQWMHVVWQAGEYDPAAPVWRLEFQLRREALREMHFSELSDIEGRLGSLWSHLTSRWLRLVVPLRGDRPERWPTDPAWQELRRADFGSIGSELLRERKRSADIARLEAQLFGLLSTRAALTGHSSLPEAVRDVEHVYRRRLTLRGEEFRDAVERKLRRLVGVRGL